MDMIFHTAEEIISLGNVEKRWSIGYKELAHIIFSGSLTLFSCYDIRKVDGIVCFGGKETTFRQEGLSVYEKFDEEHEIDVEDYYNDFANGCYIGKDIEINFYLLTTQIRKYETENPYLLGKKLEGQEAQEAFQQTAQADSPLSDLQPMLSPIGRQSEESDDARVAELEALARKRAVRGLDTEQAEELEKVRKELEAEKVSHARTRKEMEEKIERLEQQLAEKDKARGQGVDGAKDKYEEEPIGKGRGSYLAMIDALTKAISVKDRDLASWLEAKIAAIGYDGPKAQAIRNILNDVAAHRKKKIGR